MRGWSTWEYGLTEAQRNCSSMLGNNIMDSDDDGVGQQSSTPKAKAKYEVDLKSMYRDTVSYRS